MCRFEFPGIQEGLGAIRLRNYGVLLAQYARNYMEAIFFKRCELPRGYVATKGFALIVAQLWHFRIGIAS